MDYEAHKVVDFLKAGMLAAFGGLVGHLVDVVHRSQPFSWAGFGCALLVAFFVGQVLGDVLPENLTGRDGLLMVAGTSAYPILALLQDRLKTMLQGGSTP